MSARRTWTGTSENGAEITFTGYVDLKVWKKLPRGRSLKSNTPLQSGARRAAQSVLRRRQSEEQTNLTDFM